MNKGSLSGLNHLKGPLWSMIPSEEMLVSVVHAASQTDEAWGPCGHMQSVPLTDAFGFAASVGVGVVWVGVHPEVNGIVTS